MSIQQFPIWKFLAGFTSESDAWSYVSNQGVQLSSSEEDQFKLSIKKAAEFVRRFPSRDNVSPKISKIPAIGESRIKQLEEEPTFSEYRQGATSLEWGVIEIDKVRCFQQNLNLDYISQLETTLPKDDDFRELLKFCQPLIAERQSTALPVGFNSATNTYTVVSENLDFRIQGNISGQAKDPHGVQRSFVGFFFGFGLPQITVAEYQGKFILRNGYHRAFALLRAGIKNVPVLIVHCMNYSATGGAAPGFMPPDLVMSSTPPMLEDYLTEAAVDVPRRRMRVIVSVHAETQIIGA